MSHPTRSAGQQWPVAAFTAAYMLAAVVGAARTRNFEFVFYIVVMTVMIAAVAAVYLRVGLSKPAMWALSVWGASHMAGGLLPVPEGWAINGDIRVLYSLWLIPGYLKYDHVVHAYGFGVTTWVCWLILRQSLEPRLGKVQPTPTLMTVCAAAGTGFGAMNEVVEFAATMLVPQTNVGGYINTGWDLVANVVGAAAAAVTIWVCGLRKESARASPDLR